MFERLFLVLCAVVLTAGGAVAQGGQWTYVGTSELFMSADDYPYAQVCVPPGWTPANSGVPDLAGQWALISFDSYREMQQAIAAQGRCDIAALPGDALGRRPDLLALTRSLGLSDMTQALVAAGGGGSDAAPSAAAVEIARLVESSCAVNAMRSRVIDCACLGTLALERLIDGTFAAPGNGQQAAASTVTNALTREGVPAACINGAGITAHLVAQADRRIATPMSRTDSVLTDPDGYRACVVAEGLARFRADPRLVLMNRSGNYVEEAILACNDL